MIDFIDMEFDKTQQLSHIADAGRWSWSIFVYPAMVNPRAMSWLNGAWTLVILFLIYAEYHSLRSFSKQENNEFLYTYASAADSEFFSSMENLLKSVVLTNSQLV